METEQVRFSLRVLGLSFLCAYICAAAFILATVFTGGPNQQAGVLILLDPFVLMVAIPVASVIALLLYPIALFCVRGRNLHRCAAFVIALTAVFTFFATLFNLYLGLLGGPALGLAASVFCRLTRLQYFQAQGAQAGVA